MPEVSGLQLLRSIREDPRYKDLPVIMCTVQGDRDSVMQAAKLKVNGYIVKPIVASQVLKQVDKVMQQTQPPIEDKHKIATRLGMPTSDYMKVLSDFLSDMQERISRLHQYITENNALEIQILANAIRGTADTLGAWNIRDAAQKLEEMGKNGELQESEYALATLSTEVTRLREHVGLED